MHLPFNHRRLFFFFFFFFTDKGQIQLDQMTELTTQYGDDIAYFWFDHHAAPTWDAIDDIVRTHQPQCAMLGPDCWLSGQESGFSSYPMWHGVDTTDNTTHGRPVSADGTNGNPHGTWFKVWESDCSNYDNCHPWFFGGDNPQSLALMMEHWESVYGRGQNYILNLPPSPNGIITPKMAASAAAFGAERLRRYGPGSSAPEQKSECELGRTSGRMAQWGVKTTSRTSRTIGGNSGAGAVSALVLPVNGSFDRIFLSEDVISDGQLVAQYVVETCAIDAPAAADAALDADVSAPAPGCTEDDDDGVDVGSAESRSIGINTPWTRVVGPHFSKYGGATIGTHHIDVLNTTSGVKYARLRLLDVIPAPTLPMISFRILYVSLDHHHHNATVPVPVPVPECDITNFGAVGDNSSLSTKAIQAAIDGCHANHPGGSRVVVPAGAFKTGSLMLRSNLELHLAAGAGLYGSDEWSEYPIVPGLPFGTMFRALISGYGMRAIIILFSVT